MLDTIVRTFSRAEAHLPRHHRWVPRVALACPPFHLAPCCPLAPHPPLLAHCLARGNSCVLSHAVFGPHTDPPWLAVCKTYLTYFSTIVASTAVNLALVAGAALSHELALIITATFSVGWSYIALSYTWRRSPKSEWRSCCVVDTDSGGRRWYRSVEAPDASLEEQLPCSSAVASTAEQTPASTPVRQPDAESLREQRDELAHQVPGDAQGVVVGISVSPCVDDLTPLRHARRAVSLHSG